MIFPAARPCDLFRAGRARPESPAGSGARNRNLPASFRRLARERRAAAGIELAIGVSALLVVAWTVFDVISLARASTAGARVAATMADYVSRESAPDGDEMDELGKFLHEREFRMPSAVVYVISAVKKPAGDDPAAKIWPNGDFSISSDDSKTTDLLATCKTQGGWRTAVLGDAPEIKLSDNDVMIVVEVCVKMLREGRLSEFVSGTLYRIHAMPARGSGGEPEEPTPSSTSAEAAMPSWVGAGTATFLHGSLDPVNRSVGPVAQAPATLGGVA